MKLKELKEFLSGLTPEELDQDFYVEVNSGRKEVLAYDQIVEDLYYDSEYPEEGCFPKSWWEGGDIEEIELKVGIPIGTVMFYTE